jgi:cytochrome c oxidase cbb3-type subunit 3
MRLSEYCRVRDLPRPFRCAVLVLALASCSEEVRTSGAELPQTQPTSAQDPREASYGHNAYQLAQGGRYFTWYGCGECHAGNARGRLNLADAVWSHGGNLDQVYAFITHGHSGVLATYGERIPAEQVWQITAYVRNLPQLKPEKRQRQDVDQVGEPQGSHWAGPVQ